MSKYRSAVVRCATDQIADRLVEADYCQPKLMTVPIVPDKPGVILYPQCTSINRCGGCCGHEALECVPTGINTVHVGVVYSSN